MSYLQEALMPDEKLMLQVQIHPFVFVGPTLWTMLSTACYVAAAAYWSPTHEVLSFVKDFVEGVVLHTKPAVLAVLGFSVLCGAWGVIKAIMYVLGTELGFSHRRVIGRTGLVVRRTIEIPLGRVESLDIHDQSLLGRLFGYGTLNVVGTGGTNFSIRFVTKPIDVRSHFYSFLRNLTQQRRPAPQPQGGSNADA